MQGEGGTMSLLYFNALTVKIFVLFLELSHLVQREPTNEGVSLSWMVRCSEIKSDVDFQLSLVREMSVGNGWDRLSKGRMKIVSRLH
jgi:hypothetical protein